MVSSHSGKPLRKNCIYHSYDLQQNSKSSVGFLKTGDIKNEYYDLILLSDVVEHCYDFQFLLKTIFKN